MKKMKLRLNKFGDVVGLDYRGVRGVRLARNSSCRKVFACGEFVVKVEDDETREQSLDHGIDGQCEIEWKRWNALKPHQKKWFAPCVAFEEENDIVILVQRRIHGRAVTSISDLERITEEVTKIFPDITDIRPRNTKRTPNGRLYVVDYGVDYPVDS